MMEFNLTTLYWVVGGLFCGVLLLGAALLGVNQEVKELRQYLNNVDHRDRTRGVELGEQVVELGKSIRTAMIQTETYKHFLESVLEQEVALCKAMNTVADKIGEVISEAAEVKRAAASVEKSCDMVQAEVNDLRTWKEKRIIEFKGPALDRAQIEDLVAEMEKRPIREMYS